MKVVTSDEMRRVDKKTIEEYGIPGVVLMERAGLAVASKIKEVFGQKRVIIVAGSGNNGGDGFAVARNLSKEGWDVRVFLTSKPENIKGDALLQYRIAKNFGVSVLPVKELLTHSSSFVTKHSIFVDALFGTGLSKTIAGTLSEVIRQINKSKQPIISVDIPSGISSDTGQIMGEAVKADCTVTFGLPKRGHLLYPGAEYSGRLFIEDIGFPEELLRSDVLNVGLLTKQMVSLLLPKRKRYSHKGDYGHVLIVAGSRGKTGAALMAAKACLRSGAGLVTIGVPASIVDVFQSRVTEEMTLALPDKEGTLSEKASGLILDFLKEEADVLAIGPGIGIGAETNKIVRKLIDNAACPLVIDADGINALQGERQVLTKSKAPVILTPHPGEMARLLNPITSTFTKGGQGRITLKTYDIEKDRLNTALSFAKET